MREGTHTNEPGCAVFKALESGEIDSEHYDNFNKLRGEYKSNLMPYAEKRKKDKKF